MCKFTYSFTVLHLRPILTVTDCILLTHYTKIILQDDIMLCGAQDGGGVSVSPAYLQGHVVAGGSRLGTAAVVKAQLAYNAQLPSTGPW